MGELVAGDDGMPIEEVGSRPEQKYEYLIRYLEISRAARKKFIGPGKGGATYVYLFCGPGRASEGDGETFSAQPFATNRRSFNRF